MGAMYLSEIEENCKNIKHFRGVFLRDNLPKYPLNTEIGILNLDSVENSGTHWTLYFKNEENNICFYFDSFGHRPPVELINYLQNDIWYSTFQLQELNTKYCGHLCVILVGLIDKLKNFPKAVYYLVELLDK